MDPRELARVGGGEARVVHRALQGERPRPHDPESGARGAEQNVGGGSATAEQRIPGEVVCTSLDETGRRERGWSVGKVINLARQRRRTTSGGGGAI